MAVNNQARREVIPINELSSTFRADNATDGERLARVRKGLSNWAAAQ